MTKESRLALQKKIAMRNKRTSMRKNTRPLEKMNATIETTDTVYECGENELSFVIN